MSITLDTNIYVSAFEFGGVGSRILGFARFGNLEIDISDSILEELIAVLRDDFRWDGYRLHFLRGEIAGMTRRVFPVRRIAVTDDPDDNAILECAVAGHSDAIVTEDKDLLRLGSFEGIQILRGPAFLKTLAF